MVFLWLEKSRLGSEQLIIKTKLGLALRLQAMQQLSSKLVLISDLPFSASYIRTEHRNSVGSLCHSLQLHKSSGLDIFLAEYLLRQDLQTVLDDVLHLGMVQLKVLCLDDCVWLRG
jgi:hypothetical protein